MPAKSVSYRDLRNTPAKVFERLANGEPLALMADGSAKALLIPVEEGDAAAALDAWKRGRALLALARMQLAARRDGTSEVRLPDISKEITAQRKSRRAREIER